MTRSRGLLVERATGLVVAAWLCWQLVLLALFRSDPLLFGRLHQRAGSVPGRVAASVVAAALVAHAVLGLRRILLDTPRPSSSRRRAGVDALAAFLVVGLSIVATAVIFEPVIEDVLR